MERARQETVQFGHVCQRDKKRGERQEDWAEGKTSASRAEIGRRYILLTTSEPPPEKCQKTETKNKNPW